MSGFKVMNGFESCWLSQPTTHRQAPLSRLLQEMRHFCLPWLGPHGGLHGARADRTLPGQARSVLSPPRALHALSQRLRVMPTCPFFLVPPAGTLTCTSGLGSVQSDAPETSSPFHTSLYDALLFFSLFFLSKSGPILLYYF